jgi:hypothetical protein
MLARFGLGVVNDSAGFAVDHYVATDFNGAQVDWLAQSLCAFCHFSVAFTTIIL